jgi:GR25 family glycosyltransferase involved in LPS biosynthesis
MRAYVIALMNVPESVQYAQRAVQSALEFNLDPVMEPGVWREEAESRMLAEGLKLAKWDCSYSRLDAVIGCFLAHYYIWQKITEPSVIMEHDAVVVAPVPELQGDIVSIGKPSFGLIRQAPKQGEQKLFSTGDKIPGAHGYYVTPAGAKRLVETARSRGILPADKFMNPKWFPDIAEYHPWCIEARDDFTTIQRVKGCLSKHAYRRGNYRII